MAWCEKSISIGGEESTSIDMLSGVPIQCVYLAVTRVRSTPLRLIRLHA
jgi:hypothetical protein